MNSRRICLLLLLALLGACATPPPVPEDHYYRLSQLELDRRFAQPLLGGRVLVEEPRAAGVRRGRHILYSDDPRHIRFRQYHYHHWEDTMPDLIQGRIADALTRSGAAEHVTIRPQEGLDYRLHSRLYRFEQLRKGTTTSVIVDLEFWVTPARDRDRQMLQARYEETVAVSGSEMVDTAAAFGVALDRIIGRLVDELSELNP